MKKILSVILIFAMAASLLAGCGGKKDPVETVVPANLEGSMEQLLEKVLQEQPVEFAGATTVVDLADTSEQGLWALKSFTGLDSAEKLIDAAVFEPMINAIAFSMVMVRTVQGADPKAVAEDMKAGIDPRKWICVEADDLKVAGFGDVVLLIMVDSSSDYTAQSFVDALQKTAGMEPTFVI